MEGHAEWLIQSKQTMPVKTASLEHAAVSVVVDPLGQFGKFLGIFCRSEAFFDHLIERGGGLRRFPGCSHACPTDCSEAREPFPARSVQASHVITLGIPSFTVVFVISVKQKIIPDGKLPCMDHRRLQHPSRSLKYSAIPDADP